DLEPGDTVLLDLPPHWLVPVFLGAAWTAGLVVTTDRTSAGPLVVCGPDTLTEHAGSGHAGSGHAGSGQHERVLACSLRPFAVRFAEALAPDVVDYGLSWPGQSDVFLALEPVHDSTPAWRDGAGEASHIDLIEEARRAHRAPSVRLLTDVHPAEQRGVPVLLAPLVAGGSVVLVSGAAGDSWSARGDSERATAVLRAAQPPSE
ncbi:MAG: TIGR03089 family protein, partial [Marmoricola sp.]